MAAQTFASLVFAGIGALFTAISVPLIQGRIPRNHLYGFRTRKTLSSDRIWYHANRYMARDMFVAGLATVAGSLVLLAAWPLLGLTEEAVATLGIIVMCVPLTITLVRGYRYLRRL